ncbi:hypothetical protein Mal64_04430 [Pseudobythopirellula maris]|uniref:DUF4112 domain-containing protein n=1 Tax=Pseudobythopirellula maris TaxID=2527991 RepID=A0A5C5ZRZ2_9BACT|nr:DUF4112 domain-containing protein [Pseudobythopirellula maris]TWT90060.1 hypothetical protein Mal64_04430 [Pseudobythopirellula maris]
MRSEARNWFSEFENQRTRSLGSMIDRVDVERLASQLDDAFRVPGTNIRFGWDSIIGLVPGVGDAATTLLAIAPVLAAYREGVGRWTLARMIGNVALDATLGAVPILGDAFDLFFKANRRNLRHLKRHREKTGRLGPNGWVSTEQQPGE